MHFTLRAHDCDLNWSRNLGALVAHLRRIAKTSAAIFARGRKWVARASVLYSLWCGCRTESDRTVAFAGGQEEKWTPAKTSQAALRAVCEQIDRLVQLKLLDTATGDNLRVAVAAEQDRIIAKTVLVKRVLPHPKQASFWTPKCRRTFRKTGHPCRPSKPPRFRWPALCRQLHRPCRHVRINTLQVAWPPHRKRPMPWSG